MCKTITQTFAELKQSFDSETIESLEDRELVELARMVYDAGEIYDIPEGTLEANEDLLDAIEDFLADTSKANRAARLRNTIWASLWGAYRCDTCEMWRQDAESRFSRLGVDFVACDDCMAEYEADAKYEDYLEGFFFGGRSL